jgi:putative aldouronate transport system permease protein
MAETAVIKQGVKKAPGTHKWKNPNRLSGKANVILNLIFIFMMLACILPIVIVISVSLSSETTILREGYGLLPKDFSLETYRFVMKNPKVIFSAYKVTTICTILATIFCVINVSLFAYPLSRPDFKFKTEVTFFMFFTMLFGGGLVSYYIMMTGFLRLRDSIFAMILPYSFNAFWVIVMRTFFKTQVPDSIIESARIDGAGEWRTLIQIVLPISLPGLATIALFTALAVWNEFMNCILFIDDVNLHNLQTMIYRALTSARMLREIAATMGSSDALLEVRNLPNETFRMALSVITIGPIVLVYPFFQRYFIKGLTIGSIKG